MLVGGPVLWIAGFALGAAFGDRAGTGPGQRARSFFLRNPILIAAALGFAAPDSLAPPELVELSQIVLLAILPLGFFAVGALLVEEREEEGMRLALSPGVVTALSLRLVAAPVLLVALAAPLIDLPPSYALMIAMPCGLNSLAVAHVYGLHVRTVAAGIAWGTALALAVGLVADAVV